MLLERMHGKPAHLPEADCKETPAGSNDCVWAEESGHISTNETSMAPQKLNGQAFQETCRTDSKLPFASRNDLGVLTSDADFQKKLGKGILWQSGPHSSPDTVRPVLPVQRQSSLGMHTFTDNKSKDACAFRHAHDHHNDDDDDVSGLSRCSRTKESELQPQVPKDELLDTAILEWQYLCESISARSVHDYQGLQA